MYLLSSLCLFRNLYFSLYLSFHPFTSLTYHGSFNAESQSPAAWPLQMESYLKRNETNSFNELAVIPAYS